MPLVIQIVWLFNLGYFSLLDFEFGYFEVEQQSTHFDIV